MNRLLKYVLKYFKLKWIFWLFTFLIITSLLFISITFGYQHKWTGFGDFMIETLPNQSFRAGKTLWDWLELLIIPLALVFGGFLLNRTEKRHEIRLSTERAESDRKIAENRNQEIALSEYFDRMSELLLNINLKNSNFPSEPRNVARARTLTILRRLNGERKAIVLNFLSESELILKGNDKSFPIVNLIKADLSEIYLSVSYLDNIFLEGVNLNNSNIFGTSFKGAILTGCDFVGSKIELADFQGAYLEHSRFNKANLDCVDFSDACLFNVCFFRSSLQYTNFTSAELEGADFQHSRIENSIFEGAKMEGVRNITQEQLNSAFYFKVPPTLPQNLYSPPIINEDDYYKKFRAYRSSRTTYME